MVRFSPKIEIINYFDDLICQIDIDTEECLERYEDELLEQRTHSNRKLGSDYKFQIRFIDSQKEKEEEETPEFWPESTKVADYLSEIRMRKIEELSEGQKDWVANALQFKHLREEITNEEKKEELKSQLFAEKFYFQAKITKSAYKNWYFNLVTFVSDFYISQSEINILQKLINAETNDIKRICRDSKLDLEKMVLIRLLYKCFWENFTTRMFPSQTIHVFKQDLLNMMRRIKHIKLKYPIGGLNLNVLSTNLWNLEHLDLDISKGRLEEVNIDNLPFLQSLRLKSGSVERISLKSLNALKRMFLYINHLQTGLQADLYEQIPNIEKLTVKSDSFSFDYVKEEKSLLISFKRYNAIDFAPIYPISNEIETLRINDSTISNSRTFVNVCRHFRNVLDLSLSNSRIEKIDRQMFVELSNLRSLSLHYNRNLKTIDYNAFSNLKELTHLSLVHNSIRSLDKRVFLNLVNLEILNVTENGIKRLDKEIFSNQRNLRQLYLGSSKYKRIDHELFVGLEYLYELHLPGCVLTNFDLRVLDNLPRLKRILLSKMSISHNETEILNRFNASEIDFQFYR